jgi:hypothetical protein
MLKRNEFVAGGLQDAVARLRDDQPPLSEWIAGYARSLDRATLDQALSAQEPADPVSVPGGNEGPRGAPRALIALPESLAILKAARDGAALPDWATQSTAWDLARARIDTPTAMAALLRQARLGTTIAPGDRLPPVSGHLNLLYDLEWPQPVLESVAAMLVDTASRLRASAPGRRVHQRFRSPRTSETAEARARHADRRAQVFLASIQATRLAAAADGDAARTVLALLDAAGDALDQPPAHADAQVRLTVSADDSPGRWRAATPLAASTLADALRGALLGAPSARPGLTFRDAGLRLDLAYDIHTIDKDVLHRQYLGTAPYRILTAEGLPRCLIATPAPDGTVIVTPRGQAASYRVRDDGSWQRMAEWPAPIVGEIHGESGQMAWSYTTPACLMCRAHDQEAPVVADVEFQTYTAVWWQNRVVVTTSDGVWQWRPGERPHRLLQIPPAVIGHRHEDRIELDPLPIESGRLVRRRLARGWALDLRAGESTEHTISPLGQRWSRHEAGDVAATSHPEADVVRLASAVRELYLAWPAPRAALWCDRALILNTSNGDVVLFPRLADGLGH